MEVWLLKVAAAAAAVVVVDAVLGHSTSLSGPSISVMRPSVCPTVGPQQQLIASSWPRPLREHVCLFSKEAERERGRVLFK